MRRAKLCLKRTGMMIGCRMGYLPFILMFCTEKGEITGGVLC
jgi:hypothetical protein